MSLDLIEHTHRHPEQKDFVGKTVQGFDSGADNIWRIWFTDGTGFAIQAESNSEGIPYMELCDTCID